ncbi:MAG: YdcF family protein [Castellaniella sp.]|uniref:YdcF family protein n=1 Tax=Castellaniella sp. TaxID=1955812 RepID=UPI0011FEF2E3|nr:YdcF family protein [Castellaniella sp.]TAN30599.1 MAG: YdcF family protein [Castellaniella sp.]
MSITEFLANLIIPLNLSITLLVVATLLFILRWRKTAGFLAATAIAWITFWSLPTTSLWAGGMLEQRYPHEPAKSLPVEPAIVVLGGNTLGGRRNWFEPYNGKTAVLRTDTAAHLYEAGRAPLIIVSGAALDGGRSEATVMAAALERDGVPADAIVRENHSLTTHQNALYTAQILRARGIQDFLLVTSALHMPRAMATFQKQGLSPVAAPSPPQIVVPDEPDFSFWLPDLLTLHASRSIVKEYLGMLVYWLRGWA